MTRLYAVLLASVLWTGPAGAVTCTVVASPLKFGIYDPLQASATNVATTVSVSCSTTVSVLVTFTMTLSGGSGTVANRLMQSGSYNLAYQVYTDSAHSQIWGDGTGGSVTPTTNYLLAAVATTNSTVTGYGQIPGKQLAAPGDYVDNLVVSLTY